MSPKHPNDVVIPKVVPIDSKRKELMSLKTIKASDVTMRSQPWLWEPYIPLETCTLVAGTGGIGKSTFLLYLASLVSNGSKFKINSLDYSVPTGNVLILSAEDSIESSIVPKLKAANADLTKIEIVISALHGDDKDERFLALDNDLFLLEQKIKDDINIKLLIIDPITAYLGKVRENQSAEVRNFILKINRIAEKYKIAVILNTHTRKKGGGDHGTTAADEIMGSSAWHNTVRQVFTVSRDHEDKTRILFINCKSNCASPPEAFDYRVEPHEVMISDEIIKTALVKLLSGNVTITADEALNKDIYEKRLITDDAKELIMSALQFGSKTAEHMRSLANAQGISDATLKLARQRLKNEGVNIIVEPAPTDGRKNIWYIGT